MTLAVIVIAWFSFPIGLWLILKRKTTYALPLVAVVVALALFAIGEWMQSASTVISLSSEQNTAPQTSTYVLSKGRYLQGLSVDYIVAAALCALIVRFGYGVVLRLIPIGFCLFYLGCTAVALQSAIAAACVPHRYADYQAYLGWINWFNFTSSILGFVGLAVLILLTLTALIQTLLRRKT
ncbi:MAG: hypothetical protein V4586_01950 [Pseudomonadota bacterium]